MNDEQVWKLEQRLWLEGAAVYQELLDPQCVMAFPEPVGILRGTAIVQSVEAGPRWSKVTMTLRTVGRPDTQTIVLAYRAEGERAGAEDYIAFCTSTYRCSGGQCKLVQHQQTPVQ